MRKFVAVYLSALLTIFAGCALLLDTSEKTAKHAGDAIAEYCKLPKESRADFRAMVAKAAAPNSAVITCASD